MKEREEYMLDIFLTMMKIGLFTFGGGYAMLALLESELVTKKKWIGREEFLDMVAIAESTPGPIAINAATYIGYKRGGFLGAFLSTLGVCIPSFVIIYLISLFFDAFLSFSIVSYAFKGIQIGVIYLILSAGIKMLKGVKKTAFNLSVLIGTAVIMILFSLFAVEFSAVLYILISGALGLFVYFLGKLKKADKEAKK